MAKRRRAAPGKSSPQPAGAPPASAEAPSPGVGLGWKLGAVAAAGLAAWALWAWSPGGGEPVEPTQAESAGPRIAGRSGYVDGATCAGCHADIAASYQQTGMGRSFYRADAGTMSHLGAGPVEYFHEPSKRRYRIERRDGKYFQRRWQQGSDGAEINVVDKEIHYVMGSGNHARTYLHQYPDGRLIELPLGWYAERAVSWR